MDHLLLTIVSRTPLWVWFLLAALIALGLSQARTRIVPRRRVIALPLGLGLFALSGATALFGLHPLTVQLPWLLGLALGLAAGWATVRQPVQALPDGRFKVAGSLLPLALMLVVFLLRYVVKVAIVMNPDLALHAGFVVPVALLYGVPAGVLAARARHVLSHAAPACGVRSTPAAAAAA